MSDAIVFVLAITFLNLSFVHVHQILFHMKMHSVTWHLYRFRHCYKPFYPNVGINYDLF